MLLKSKFKKEFKFFAIPCSCSYTGTFYVLVLDPYSYLSIWIRLIRYPDPHH